MTFDLPEALECRGIAFDRDTAISSPARSTKTLLQWYGRTRLKDEFSLRALVNETLVDAIEG